MGNVSIMPGFEKFEGISQWLSIATIEGVAKWMLVVGLGMYCLFALVIIKQVSIMSETYEASANSVVKLFAWVHFLMSLLLIIAVILVW